MLIRVRNVSKVFPLSGVEKVKSLGRALLGATPARAGAAGSCVAVDDVSLEIREGERVGVVGRNGAGKTTLLQMIAGLAEPSSGSIEVGGHVNCIMTLGVGLREELSGRENIYVDGEINGKTRAEVDEIVDEIIDFADIGEFIDHPVRTYSSGMKARLSFGMIVSIEPEILLIDEALSAGDARFAQKAYAKAKELCSRGRILMVVSHSMGSIVEMCNRCLWMDRGRVRMDGDPGTVAEAYVAHVRQSREGAVEEASKRRLGARSVAPGFQVASLEFLDRRGQRRTIFEVGEEMTVRLGVRAEVPLVRPDLRLSVERTDGILMMENLASDDGFECRPIHGEAFFEVPLGPIRFGKSTYQVRLDLLDRDREGTPLLATSGQVFQVDNPDYPFENPALWSRAEWEVKVVAASEER